MSKEAPPPDAVLRAMEDEPGPLPDAVAAAWDDDQTAAFDAVMREDEAILAALADIPRVFHASEEGWATIQRCLVEDDPPERRDDRVAVGEG